MSTIEHTVTINRSVTDVFKFVADFSNHHKWQPPSVQIGGESRVRVGDMIIGKRQVAGRMVFVNADVVDYVMNQKLAYSGVTAGFPFRTTYTFEFTSGGSKVTELTIINIPWWSFFLRPFIVGSMNGQIRTALENLRQYLEAQQDRTS